VIPDNATNKAIVWTVKAAGGTGVAAIVNGKFTPAAAGTLTATVANGKAPGEDFAKDFAIVVSPAFVAVTGISGAPTGGVAGTQIDLGAATAAPDNATNKTIAWTVKDAGATGVGDANIVGGKFTPSSAGTLTLTATIANGSAPGTPFARDFEIIISPANTFVAVTNINGVPTGGEVGSEVDLSVAMVVPDNANNKTIAWTVKDAGGTGVSDVANGKFTATAPGTVKLTAAIANGEAEGKNYAKDFDILISVPGSFVPVTNIAGVPETGVVGSIVSLAGATVVPETASYQTISWVVKAPGAGVTAIAGNSFTPTATGTVTLTARILSGAAAMQPYTQDFAIAINPAFVAVTDINGLPASKNAVTGVAIDLTAGISVIPTDATNKAIEWSVKNAAGTGLTNDAVASGAFAPANGGTATLTATILNGLAQGSNYTQDITITIIKPVERIDNVPLSGTKGYAVNLGAATAAPSDATNKTIVWSVKTAGAGVTAVAGNSFTPTETGTVTLTATIENGSAMGTAYTHDYTIAIVTAGEEEIDFGLVEDTSILLRGNLGGTDQGQLSRDTPIVIAKDAVYYVSLITGSGGSYSEIVWYLNGTKQTIGGSGSLIYLDTSTARTIKLAVVAKKGGQVEGSGVYTFTINN
jgi:endo-1,4-beta-xylanase